MVLIVSATRIFCWSFGTFESFLFCLSSRRSDYRWFLEVRFSTWRSSYKIGTRIITIQFAYREATIITTQLSLVKSIVLGSALSWIASGGVVTTLNPRLKSVSEILEVTGPEYGTEAGTIETRQ